MTSLLQSLLVAGMALLISSCGFGLGSEESTEPGCSPPSIDLIDGMDEARVRAVPDGRVVRGWRDGTATVVAICLAGPSLPDGLTLRSGEDEYEPAGGVLNQVDGRSTSYSIFAPTSTPVVDFEIDGRPMASMSFGPVGHSVCSLSGVRRLRVLGCGALMRVLVSTDLPYRPNELELIDARISDGSASDLGFHFYGAERRAGRLWLDFSFRRPSSRHLEFEIAHVYVDREGQIFDALKRPFKDRFVLRSS